MQIDCVLTATNAEYSGFLPYFVAAWNKIAPRLDVKVIFVGAEVPRSFDHLRENIIPYEPPTGVSDAFVAQFIRVLYPALLPYENAVLISDVDMIPLSRDYYFRTVAGFHPGSFVYYRDVDLGPTEYAICYHAAAPSTWAEVFGIESASSITKVLTDVYSRTDYDARRGGAGWSTDQEYLRERIDNWSKSGERFQQMKDSETGYQRLCRSGPYLKFGGWRLLWDYRLISRIRRGQYTDFHALTPYTENWFANRMVLAWASAGSSDQVNTVHTPRA